MTNDNKSASEITDEILNPEKLKEWLQANLARSLDFIVKDAKMSIEAGNEQLAQSNHEIAGRRNFLFLKKLVLNKASEILDRQEEKIRLGTQAYLASNPDLHKKAVAKQLESLSEPPSEEAYREVWEGVAHHFYDESKKKVYLKIMDGFLIKEKQTALLHEIISDLEQREQTHATPSSPRIGTSNSDSSSRKR